MAYDLRNRSQSPLYARPAITAPMYGQPSSLYPRVGQNFGGNHSPFHLTSSPSSTTGIGIRVAIKPEYRITPPPPLAPHVGDIPQSTFHFDFDLEKKILAEAEKESQNWSRLGLENLPSRGLDQASMQTSSYCKLNIPLHLNGCMKNSSLRKEIGEEVELFGLCVCCVANRWMWYHLTVKVAQALSLSTLPRPHFWDYTGYVVVAVAVKCVHPLTCLCLGCAEDT